jgi:Cytochrome c, mono- and diheme variants
MNGKWMLTAAALALTAALAACGGGNGNGAETAPPAGNAGNGGNGNGGATVDTAQAESIYQNNCVGCHATDLAGGVGPSLQKVGAEMSADDIRTIIANGQNGMPAFKDRLANEDIDALAAWLATMK